MHDMRKIPCISLLFLCILATRPISAQEVDLRMQVPGQLVAGTPARVTVTIRKSSLESFARFQQDIPAGMTVTAVEAAGGDVSFDGSRINIFWQKLPVAPEFGISYMLTASADVRGSFTLGGRFSYLVGGERKEKEMASQTVSVISSSATGPRAGEPSVMSSVLPEGETQDISDGSAVYRQKPYLVNEGTAYRVNVLISRGKLAKFARLEEQILSNHEVRLVDSHEAIFSVEGGVAKFLWMKLPEEKYFTVSYDLLPSEGSRASAPVIKGILSYIHDGEPGEEAVSERQFSLTSTDQASLETIVKSLALYKTGTTEEAMPRETVQRSAAQPPVQHPPTQPTGTKTVSTAPGIIYKVQVAAFKSPVDEAVYFRGQGLNDPVSEEYHNGLYKYTVGSYQRFADARAANKRIVETTSYTQAFIVAFKDGVRIKVADALRQTGEQ